MSFELVFVPALSQPHLLAAPVAAALRDLPDAAEAEVIVVNTCGFIGEAKKESIDTIFEMAELKKEGACKTLVVSGCLSQRYPTELAAKMPEVDHFLGSSDMLKLGKVLAGDADRMLVGNPADWVIRASDPRVVTEVPDGVGFAAAAKKAFPKWRFNPMMKDGHPVAAPARIRVSFKLT